MSSKLRISNLITLALTTTVGLGLALSGPAAEKTIALKDAPGPVQKTIADQLKGGKLRGVSIEVENGKTQYEAELTVDGQHRDLIIDPAGKVLVTEALMELRALPEAVRTAFTREAGKGTVAVAEEVTREGAVSYEALIKEAGKKDRQIVVGPDGKPAPAKK